MGKEGGIASAVSVVIVCFIMGIVLIVQGVKRRDTPNSSGEQRDVYNQAADKHDSQKQFISGWQGTMTQHNPNEVSSFSVAESEIVIGGSNNEGTAGRTSRYVKTTLETYSYSGAASQISMNFGNFSRSWPMQVVKKVDVRCGRELCTDALVAGCATRNRRTSSSSSKESIYCSDVAKLREHCTRTYNSLATFQQTYSGCFEDDVCGYCEFSAYAQTLCAVVDVGLEGEVTINEDKLSCNYPFGIQDGIYTASFPPEGIPASTSIGTRPVTVEIRSSGDPYIALSFATKGTNEFENSEKEKSEGTVLIVFGIIVLILSIIIGTPMLIVFAKS